MIIAIITVLILASLAFTLWFTRYAPRLWSSSQSFLPSCGDPDCYRVAHGGAENPDYPEWSDDNLPN